MTLNSLYQYALALVMSAALSVAYAQENDFIQPHSASYEAHISHGINLNGNATRELIQRKDGTWFYKFFVDTVPASITESSEFDLNEGHIISKSYNYLLSGFLIKDRHQTVVFDPSTKTLKEKYKKKEWSLEAPADVLDRLNYQLQLQVDVGSGKKDMSYEVIHKGQLRNYQFKVLGKESIDTRLGKRETIVVEKVREGDKKRETKLWFDQTAPFALLRMIQTEPDGEFYEINITQLN